jgi:biotin carboxyl carrier protein
LEFIYEHNGEIYKIEITKDNDEFIVKLGNRTYSLMDVLERGEGLLKFQLNRRPYKCRVATSGEQRHIFLSGNVYQLKRVTQREARKSSQLKSASGAGADANSGNIVSPINGKIIRVWVDENSNVKPDQDLIIMEHRIKSPFAATVKKVHVKEGKQVELGTVLLELERAGSEKIKEDV